MLLTFVSLGTFFLGLLTGFLLFRRRGTGDSRLEAELRQQLADRDALLVPLRARETELASALARREAELVSVRSLVEETRALHEKTLKEARESNDKALGELRNTFKALSSDALKECAPEFLRLAGETLGRFQETAKGELARRQEAIDGLVKPLSESLRAYQERLQRAETAQSMVLGEVKKQLETLGSQSKTLADETHRFREVLRNNQARGRWGEETLRRVVEAAGMSAHCDFVEQDTTGDRKPDMIVRLPGERVIVVDAKVPDLDFLAALDTADSRDRARLLAQHAEKLKGTIAGLAGRNYPATYEQSLDYVVLFMPAESLFSAALEGDPDIIVRAAEQKVLLATPASLIALLRSVAVSWQCFSQSQNTRTIITATRELFERVRTFTGHLADLKAGLEKAVEGYNRAAGSYTRSVRPSGERLLELRHEPGQAGLTDLGEIEIALRPLPSEAGGTSQPDRVD